MASSSTKYITLDDLLKLSLSSFWNRGKNPFLLHTVTKFNWACHVEYDAGQIGSAVKQRTVLLYLFEQFEHAYVKSF